MNRRKFLQYLLGGTSALAVGGPQSILGLAAGANAASGEPAELTPSVVAIKRFGHEPDAAAATQAALDMLGTIDRVIRPGDVVIVKPNLVNADFKRWIGRVTNSKVMDGVLQAVVDCGGKPVVAEGTCESKYGGTTGFAEETGLLDVCSRYGAKFVDLNEEDAVPVSVPQPLLWSQVHMARAALECDKFVSVPVMKTHRAAGVTLGMKNLVGTMSPKRYSYGRSLVRDKMHSWEQQLWNQRYGGTMTGENENLRWMSLAATISDLASVRPIDLVVVDGTLGEESNSPSGDLVDIKERSGSYLILAGADPVAVDSVGAYVMRQIPERLQKLRFAASKGLGECRVQNIEVLGERLEDVVVPFRTCVMA